MYYEDGCCQKTNSNKCGHGSENWDLARCYWDCEWRCCFGNSTEVPQKVKHRIPTRSSNPTSGYTPQSAKSGMCTGIWTLMFMAALFITAQSGNHPSVHWWTHGKTKRSRCHRTEYYSALSKNEILTHATYNMDDLQDIMWREMRQTRKDEYCVILLIWGMYSSHVCRDGKWNAGCQGPGRGMRRRYLLKTVSVWGDERVWRRMAVTVPQRECA